MSKKIIIVSFIALLGISVGVNLSQKGEISDMTTLKLSNIEALAFNEIINPPPICLGTHAVVTVKPNIDGSIESTSPVKICNGIGCEIC